MIKKLGLFTAVCLMGMHSLSASAQEMSAEEQYKAQREARPAGAIRPKLRMPKSIIVCRAKQCAPANLSMAREYIYNTLLHMFDSNARQKALICEGSANTHSCTEEFLSIPITVGVTPAYMYIDDVKIADVSINQKNTMATNLLLNWGVSYNGQTPVCRPSKNLLYVKSVDNVIMEDNGYTCKMTTIGSTTVSTMWAIDYIDLDYGYIGGYYSIGLSGPAYGGGSGYMIMRLPNDISIEAQDFEIKRIEPKIEETVEEIEIEVPNPEAQNATPATPQSDTAETAQNAAPAEQNAAPAVPDIAIQAPHGAYPTNGQFLYDSNSGQYIPLKAMDLGGGNPAQSVAPVNLPAPFSDTNAFRYASTARGSYGSAQSTMPSDNELLTDVMSQAHYNSMGYNMPSQSMMSSLPQNPVYGQYLYDAQSGRYVPLSGQYQLDPVSGQYVPMSMMPPAQNQEAAAVREPQAPNVNTIIKYNHPAREYERAKAEAAAAAAAEADRQRMEAERQRLEEERRRQEEKRRKELEAQAIDFGGAKVYPVPSSNADRTTVAPTLKNSLNEYNRESRRYE